MHVHDFLAGPLGVCLKGGMIASETISVLCPRPSVLLSIIGILVLSAYWIDYETAQHAANFDATKC